MLNYNKNKNKFDFERIQLMRSKSEKYFGNISGNSELTPTPEKKVQNNNSQSDSGDDKKDLLVKNPNAANDLLLGENDELLRQLSQMEDQGSSQQDRDFRKYALGEISEIQQN